MNPAEKDKRIQEWLEGCARPFTPREFKEALETCPSCCNKGDPATTLQCLKTHIQYFCYFCMDVMPLNSEIIKHHNLVKGHFSDGDLPNELVSCPFAKCPDSGCLNKTFFYLSGLRNHIFKEHLPTLDQIIASTEHFGDSESPDNAVNSHSSGYVSATAVEGHQSALLGHNPDEEEISEAETCSRPMARNVVHHKKTPNKLQQSRHLPGLSSPVEADPYLLQCNLCKIEFNYPSELGSHKLRQTCAFFNDKFCKHCEVGFDGFSIQNCILHLEIHQKENSGE